MGARHVRKCQGFSVVMTGVSEESSRDERREDGDKFTLMLN